MSEKSDSDRPPKKRNDQTARIAALEKQLEEQTKVAELAAVFKDAGTIKTSNTQGGTNESLARKVMAIVARKPAEE